MIRFACGTCGSALRAPASMAGKRGKCAHCGKVNQVPVVLSVDVRRTGPVAATAGRESALVGTVTALGEGGAGAGSPFRSTADLVGRAGTVGGTVDLADGPRFRTAPLERDDLGGRTIDFFDQGGSRINDLAEPGEFGGGPDIFVDARRPRMEADRPAREEQVYGAAEETLPLAEFDLATPTASRQDDDGGRLRRVMFAALTVGVICGFLLGLVASHWVL